MKHNIKNPEVSDFFPSRHGKAGYKCAFCTHNTCTSCLNSGISKLGNAQFCNPDFEIYFFSNKYLVALCNF